MPGGPATVEKWVSEDIKDEQKAKAMTRRLKSMGPDVVDTIVAAAFDLPLPIYCEISRVSLPGWSDPFTKRKQLCTRWYKLPKCIVDYPQNQEDLDAKLRTFKQAELQNITYVWVMPGETSDVLEARLEGIINHEPKTSIKLVKVKTTTPKTNKARRITKHG
jgi:hypothetical protein